MSKKDNIIVLLILFLSSIIIVGACFYKINFKEQAFENLLYNVGNGIKNANTEIVSIGVKQCSLPIVFTFLILSIPNCAIKKNKKIYAILIFITSIFFLLHCLGVFTYIYNGLNKTTVYENYYVETENVALKFPEKKKNLILIFAESMETTLTSTKDGGCWDYDIIPELSLLAKDNINFSNTYKLGGALSVERTTFTAAGMVAQTSGLPLKSTLKLNGYSNFMPGAYTLGDILQKEGYNLEVMFGSDAEYGGRKEYFEEHGNYKVFDLNTASKMTEEEKVWWGFDDDNLYKWAKEEILDLSKDNKPFNFTLLTADTHFYNGYLSNNAENKYDDKYENVFAYSSKSLAQFIEWIKSQDFYKNTTIVIVGDHIGMQSVFYNKHIANKNYTRTIYNVFINSAIEEKNSKNRQFSTLDIFPTMLASMGVEIEGERLALGTNLFSGRKTLIEEIGYSKFNREISSNSKFYNSKIMQSQ